MLRFGTCSWKYDSWKGLIYSDEKNINFLKEYSAHYSTVEIDQWFWSLFPPNKVILPDNKTVESYKNSIPDNFLFTIKVPNSLTLTHFYNRNKNEPLIENPYFLSVNFFEEFLYTLRALEKNIGCLIFQFEYLNKQKMQSIAMFLDKMYQFHSALPKAIPAICIEIRNPNYLNQKYFEAIEEMNFFHVFLQGYYMPSITEVYEKNKECIKDISLIRLHGPDRKGIEKIANNNWNEIYINRAEEIESIVKMIKELEDNEVDLFVNVNNHFEGSAPLTIERIRNRLK